MYERSYGSKYAELGGYQPASHIAKLMRADIKAAIAAGELPGSPKDYSVRVENYSMGRSIHIELRGHTHLWQVCEGIVPGSETPFADGSDGYTAMGCGNVWCKNGGQYADSPHATEHDVLSVEGRRIEKVLKGIHDAYNYDGSEAMVDYFDVNYYGQVSIEDARHAKFREQEKARKEARKAQKVKAA
jgi:hypothetical protein